MIINQENSTVMDALRNYSSIGEVTEVAPYGSGHINRTYLIIAEGKKYILQRINNFVFKNPYGIMRNIKGVTEHIRHKCEIEGLDSEHCTIQIVYTDDGELLYKGDGDNYWRMYVYSDNTVAIDAVRNVDDFYASAKAFGNFQKQLSDYPAETLCEPIKDFHNTPVRYANFIKALEKNKSGRAHKATKEIEFVKAREAFTHVLEDANKNGVLPLRVTHNDTKLNNILFDVETGESVCVIDLDTVSPGYSVTDFGDAIRFGASTAAEDEKDVSKVSLDLDLFRAYVEGFLCGCDGSLEPSEIALLPEGAMMMTLECGMRFLTDYLDGDVYFGVGYPSHNLVRCRTQFALLADMENKKEQMDAIVKEVLEQKS